MKSRRVEPGPGQESVWDYPRPPRVEPCRHVLRVIFAGETIAETRSAMRVLETSHPPVYYLPVADIAMPFLTPSEQRSWCEWKGQATYFDVRVSDRVATNAAWSYPDPHAAFEAIRDMLAFYPQQMDACFVGDLRVESQAGSFYGGWVTPDIVGPFKGAPGTLGW